MKLHATRQFVTLMTVLLSATPLNAVAKIYPSIDLSSSDGESMVLNPGDEVINPQVGVAVNIHGSGNSLSGNRVNIESGTPGTGAGAAGTIVSSGGRLDLSNSTIKALGESNARGLVVQNIGSSAVLTDSTVTTEGFRSHAVQAKAGGHVEVVGSSLFTTGGNAHGLYAEGEAATITGRDVEITVQGVYAAAVRANDGGSITLDGAKLNNFGSNDQHSRNGGIEAHLASVTATNTDITSRGWGIDVSGSTLVLSQSTVNAYGTGIILSSASGWKLTPSTAVLTDVKVHSEVGDGLNVQGDGVQAKLERVQISSNGSGAAGLALFDDGIVTLKDSNIEMKNFKGVGIDNRAGILTMDGGSITTHGVGGHGLYVSEVYNGSGGRAKITARNVAVETFGNGAIGVVSRTPIADVELEGGSVITHGSTTYGVLANRGRLRATGTMIHTLGDFSPGLMMGNRGVDVALDGVDIRTRGVASDGLVAYSAQVGVDNEITIRNSHIETEDGNGITVEGSGLTANLINTMVIGKSLTGHGAALYLTATNDSDPLVPSIEAREVQLNAIRSRLEGDVAIDSGSARLSLKDHSMLTGALLAGNAGRTVDKLSLDGSSTWRMRGDSAVKDLDTTGTVSFHTPGNGFKVLDVLGTLSGGGLFEMRTDLGAGQGDLLRVGGTVEGSHRILVANSGAEPATANGAVKLVQTEGGPGSFSLANRDQVVDVGTYRYELKSDDFLDGRASDWSLVNTGRELPVIPPIVPPVIPPVITPPGPVKPRPERLSTAANAAVNTSAASTVQAIWYAESGALARRMGDSRRGKHSDGLWSSVLSERQHLDNNGGRSFKQTVTGLQLGADKALPVQGGRWLVGALAGYSDVDRSFRGEGKGSADSYFLGGYITWLADNGWYIDGTLKANHIQQDFKVEATDGRRVTGKASQNAIGVTLELGRQMQLSKGWFIEPQAGVSAVHVNGDRYRASNGLQVSAGSGDSFQLRVGSVLGRQFELTNGDFISPHVKLARVQEFDGKSTVRSNGIPIRTDLSGGRTELGLGLGAALGRNHHLYVDYEHTFGSTLDKPWSVSAGYRYTW